MDRGAGDSLLAHLQRRVGEAQRQLSAEAAQQRRNACRPATAAAAIADRLLPSLPECSCL